MDENRLPKIFLDHMKNLLGEEEYREFLASFGQGRKNALRVNLLKMTPRQFEAASPFPVEKVPWTENGYFVDYRDAPGRHPWYRAGLYYLQEPSAMAPAQLLLVSPGDKVLDLCAAPGGKATELGARLGGRGILVANEISSSRVRSLVRNIELFGITNAVVTNETPAKLARRFEGYFDRVLVDAPCSGEGMFRKDIDAAKAWYPEKVSECAAVQREIILQAADMLRPGGDMVYSTCTFEPEENELVIAHLLRERPDMELLRIPDDGRYASFSRAFGADVLARKGYEVPGLQDAAGCQKTGISSGQAGAVSGSLPDQESAVPDLTRAVRIWPHRAQGEGHFIAFLHKKKLATEEGADNENRNIDIDRSDGKKKKKKDRREELSGGKYAAAQQVGPAAQRKGPAVQRRGSAGQRKGAARSSVGNSSLQDIQLVEKFLERYAPDRNIDISRCEIRDSHVYLMPEGCPDIRGIGFLRAGLHLGELKKNRFEPSQELAMSLRPVSAAGHCFTDDGMHISIPSKDERLAAYFRGEQIRLDEPGENGWRLVCADGYPVGWGKVTGEVLKNHLSAGWRSNLG